MEALQNLLMGFAVALSPEFYLCFSGVGARYDDKMSARGRSPGQVSRLLIPPTFQMSPTGAIIMLTALFYGTQYGGTITSVLLNVRGTRYRRSPAWTATRWPSRGGRGRPLRRRSRLLHRRDDRHDRPGTGSPTADPDAALEFGPVNSP